MGFFLLRKLFFQTKLLCFHFITTQILINAVSGTKTSNPCPLRSLVESQPLNKDLVAMQQINHKHCYYRMIIQNKNMPEDSNLAPRPFY